MRNIFILGIITLALTSCATTQQVSEQKELTECQHPSGWCKEIRNTAEESYIYAQMASNTYNDGSNFKLPKEYINTENKDNNGIGFAYSIYERRIKGELKTIVISFRGTEGADFKDWWYGNAWKMQNDDGLDLFDGIRETTPSKVKIVAIGHSLGGAIALEVSLKRENVDAYVFNTSPRFSADGYNIKNKRVSIVENGEFLKSIRAPFREATQTYTSIGCSKGGPISQHEQAKLATCLTQIAAHQSDDAKQSLVLNDIQKYFIHYDLYELKK